MTALEERLRAALLVSAAQVEESPDLFARVKGSIEDDAKRRTWRRQVGAVAGAAFAGLLGLIAAGFDFQEGELLMTWWMLELLTLAVLVTLVIVLGPFIKRFGRSYAAEVFRSNPSTGKSFLVLMDFACYLIFGPTSCSRRCSSNRTTGQTPLALYSFRSSWPRSGASS